MKPHPFKPLQSRRTPIITVLDRMVAAELAKTLGAVLGVLVTIIVSRKFLSILAKAIEGELSGETIFQLLGLKVLTATAQLLPASLFMASLTVLGRMYRDQEMSVLASSGVGLSRIYRAMCWMVVPVTVVAAVLALQVMPWSERQAQALMEKDEQSADVRGIKPGRFNEFSQGDVVLYAERLSDDNSMHKIFVQSRQRDKTGVVAADSGNLKRNELGEYFVVLRNGRRYQGVPGRADFIISEFDEYAVRIDGPEAETASLKREASDSLMLWYSHTPRELAELQKRLAVPLGVLFLSFLAVPLSKIAPRSGVYGNVFTAFLIYVVYENSQKITQGLLMTEKIPLWLSYSGVYAFLLVLTAALFIRNLGIKWIVQIAREKVGL
ncbi:LPS export ABC transporter permease LptF [Methylocaldum marinum]|nr:LPS export ABC transporter permease LptF [Methylocaldum marinum]